MADPIASIRDQAQRTQLERIRKLFGQVVPSADLQDQVAGFGSQKGIYKPSGSEYALWIRQTAKGPYTDHEPDPFPDGSWAYRYSPESRRGKVDLSLDTNRALLKCSADGIPVGVFRQVRDPKGPSSYYVAGLAFVERFDGEHFVLRGEPIDFTVSPIAESVSPTFEPFESESPALSEGFRVIRDQRFGVVVRRLYHDRCSLCDIGFRLNGRSVGLEAAHIIPVQDRGTIADVRNGILLCENHHALFDRFAWTMDEDLRVVVAPDEELRRSAKGNHVLEAEGRRLPNLPSLALDLPAKQAIEWRHRAFEAAWT